MRKCTVMNFSSPFTGSTHIWAFHLRTGWQEAGGDIKRENSAHSCDPTPIDSTSSRLIFHRPSAEGCGATGIPTWHLLLYITLAYLETKSFSLNPSVNQPDPCGRAFAKRLWAALRRAKLREESSGSPASWGALNSILIKNELIAGVRTRQKPK